MKFKKVYEECDLAVDFDDTFKADSHILSIVLKDNQMNGRKFYLKGGKIYKTLIRSQYKILYSSLDSSEET